ncbi:MAG: hypothetical protein EOP09_11565 [Proteobacteria bacterium]|nr:MAG: hypothetical protein EOP09_11565 [Pseudomonadota bacterium]
MNTSTETRAREFMEKNSLIMDGEELNFPDIGVSISWKLSKVVTDQNACLVVMALCGADSGGASCTEPTSIEVLALLPGANSAQDKIASFTTLHPAPARIVAAIGEQGAVRGYSPYFVELKGASVVAALKSAYARAPYAGFSGTLVRGSKASFDPTPGRDWKVIQGQYDLRRGTTAEVLDMEAFQFDGLDPGGSAEGYWTGCQKPERAQGAECLVAPWNAAFIDHIL